MLGCAENAAPAATADTAQVATIVAAAAPEVAGTEADPSPAEVGEAVDVTAPGEEAVQLAAANLEAAAPEATPLPEKVACRVGNMKRPPQEIEGELAALPECQ